MDSEDTANGNLQRESCPQHGLHWCCICLDAQQGVRDRRLRRCSQAVACPAALRFPIVRFDTDLHHTQPRKRCVGQAVLSSADMLDYPFP